MIFEVVVLDKDRIPIFWWRPLEGLVSGLDPSLITEAIPLESEAKIETEGEIREVFNLDGKKLVIHHDGDKIGVRIIRNTFEENLDKPPKELVEILASRLLPTDEEIEYILSLIPREPFDVKHKSPGVFSRLARLIKKADIRKAFADGILEDVILSRPKDDVERLLRVAAGTYLRYFPPKYPAPKFEELVAMRNAISDPGIAALADAILKRAETGIVATILEGLRGVDVEALVSEDPYVALVLAGPPALTPEYSFVAEIIYGRFPESYRRHYLDTLKTAYILSYKRDVDLALSVFSSFKREFERPEFKVFEALKIASAAEVLLYTDADDVDRIATAIAEEAVRAQELALEGLKKSYRALSSRIVASNITLLLTLDFVGLYYRHKDSPTYRAFFRAISNSINELQDGVFEYLKYGRLSMAMAMASLGTLLPVSRHTYRALDELPYNIMRIPRRLARFALEYRSGGLEEIKRYSREAYVYLALLTLYAAALGAEFIPPDARGLVLDICKYASERMLASKEAQDRSIAAFLGLTISRVRAYKRPPKNLVFEVARLIRKRLGRSLASRVASFELQTTLEELNMPEAAELVESIYGSEL